MNKKSTNLQGGDNNLPDGLYETALPWIKNGDKILNLGCGQNFNFERVISKRRSVDITSIDIIPSNKPSFVNRFMAKDIEKPLNLNHKYDVVTFFELIEHIDKTDTLLENCYRNLKTNGHFIFSFPNLASFYGRVELLFGLQPHILEISNQKANFGTGVIGHLNNPTNKPIHHIRGITHKAMKEMTEYHKFKLIKAFGYEHRIKKVFYKFPAIAPVNIFVAKKHNTPHKP